VQRTRQVAQQKPDGNQVEKYPDCASNAVVRYAALAIDVLNRNLTDRGAMPRRQRRNKAVQLAIQRNFTDELAAIGLKGRPEIVNIHATELRHEPVGAS